jgi:hypothetical protein
MKHQRPRRIHVDVDFALIQKAHLAVAVDHDDRGIDLRLDRLLGLQVGEHEAAEAAFEHPHQRCLLCGFLAHTEKHTSVGEPAGAFR